MKNVRPRECRRLSTYTIMISHRVLSSLATAAICLSVIQPAFADTVAGTPASSDDILAQLQAFDPNTICEGRTGKNLGKCIGDVIKRISVLRHDFNQALGTERDAWGKAHGLLGVSAEFNTALTAYLASVQQKRDTFVTTQRKLEKIFFDARKQVLDTSSTTTTPTTAPSVTNSDLTSLTAICAKQSNPRGLRLCISQQLRLLNPANRPLNLSPTGARTTN